MKDLINCIEDEAFEMKEPWRASDTSLAIVVPIVAKVKLPRTYVVLDEVKDKVEISDTGSISSAKIEGDVDGPVFVRGGTMLAGKTQSRATQFGVIVVPKKAEVVTVQCVHSAGPIRRGESFEVKGLVPLNVRSSLYTSQGSTWAAVASRRGSASMRLTAEEVDRSVYANGFESGDLAAIEETVTKFSTDLQELLKNVPDHIDQVGTIIVDPDGVLGLELYNHPLSWKAFSDTIMRTFSEALAREDKFKIFKPDMEAIVPIIMEFLDTIKGATEEEVFSGNNARTVLLKAEGYVGEYTTLDGNSIHLSITRSK